MFLRARHPLAPPKKRKPNVRIGKAHQTVRLAGPEMSKLREEAYLRSGGFCERGLPRCSGYTPWLYGHLSHVKAKRNNGDTIDNVLWSCAGCHAKSHNCGGKPAPPKPRPEAQQ